ncbi:hypothetical protein ABZV87_31295 [Streptomyces tendae]|uniref:hypothetical protein n=1 Tax=Streptomyces tendae TaxID=1932 RepID=UPI0033B5928E
MSGPLCADPETAARHRDGVTVFDSTGFGLEDHVALDVLLELAEEAGIGARLVARQDSRYRSTARIRRL